MSSRYGEMGGDLLGKVVMQVLDPKRLAEHWAAIAPGYMCTTFTDVTEQGVEVFYVVNNAGKIVVWIWMGSKDD